MRLAFLAPVLMLSGGLCFGQAFVGADTSSAPTKEPTKAISFDLSAVDKTVDPCTDFYQYACGNWRKNNPIPADQVRWSRFNELSERNTYLLYQDLKKAADAPKTPLQTKYGNYFAACMNVAKADKLGTKPIEAELEAIDAMKDRKQLAALTLDQWKRFGGGGPFRVGVMQDQKDASQQILGTGQGGLTLPDRDYYLMQDERSQKLREQYLAHMTAMFVLLGDTPMKATQEAADTMRIETALAKGSMSRVEMRDPAKRYHVMTIAKVQELSPNFNWNQYLDGMNLGQVKTMNVSSPGYVQAVNAVLGTESLQAIKSYLRWQVLHGGAPLLSKPLVDENFNFFSATLQGQKEQTPRWKLCTRMTDGAMGEAVGQDWVKQNFPPAAKENMEKLVSALEQALAEDIKSLPWMSETTKVEAKKKLDAIRQKIGYPEKWRDYSTLVVKRDDLVGNVERTEVFDDRRGLAKLGKPVDESEWGMTPPTVNAYYSPPQNDINFPAGILQPPFYDNKMDPAVNLGGIGVVIGHEMTHGFDDQGSKYDLHGNVRAWWTPEDLEKFKERTECEATEYDGFTVAPGQNLNGHLTLGENTADNGGIRIAFRALEDTLAKEGAAADPGYVDGKKDGYTSAQRFFIGFGQIWCENKTEESARVAAKIDPHSSGQWRVNGSVQNFDEFGKAFGCKVGQPMMPTNSCRVW
jgi:putative endopeptidase